MKKADLDEGKKLAEAAIKWWRSTLPGFEHEAHSDEPIPKLNAWLHNKAFVELDEGGKHVSKNKRSRPSARLGRSR